MEILLALGFQALLVGPAVAFAARRGLRPRHAILLLPALPFLLSAAIGHFFWIEPGARPRLDLDAQPFPWLGPMLLYSGAPIGALTIWLSRGWRITATVLAVLETPLTFLAILFVTMQVTGSWI